MGDTAFLARAKAGPVSGLQARMAHRMYLAHPQKRKWRPAEEAEAVRVKNWELRDTAKEWRDRYLNNSKIQSDNELLGFSVVFFFLFFLKIEVSGHPKYY